MSKKKKSSDSPSRYPTARQKEGLARRQEANQTHGRFRAYADAVKVKGSIWYSDVHGHVVQVKKCTKDRVLLAWLVGLVPHQVEKKVWVDLNYFIQNSKPYRAAALLPVTVAEVKSAEKTMNTTTPLPVAMLLALGLRYRNKRWYLTYRCELTGAMKEKGVKFHEEQRAPNANNVERAIWEVCEQNSEALVGKRLLHKLGFDRYNAF